MTQPTARPWEVIRRMTIGLDGKESSNFCIVESGSMNANKSRIALLGGNKEANAQHIVHCVNLHEELVASIQRMIPWMARLIVEGVHKNCAAPMDAENALKQAEALMEKATGHKPVEPKAKKAKEAQHV